MFALAQRSPFELMEQMQKNMDQWFARVFEDGGAPMAAAITAWTPACEAHVQDGKLVVRCDVPGVDPSDIHVAVTGRTLRISGERKAPALSEDQWVRGITYGSFQRAFRLPEGIDPAAVKATCRNGVLQVELPLPKALTEITVPIAIEQPEAQKALAA
jgi:HSP20 family protein